MLLNIAYPRNGTCKQFEVLDEVLRRVNLTDYVWVMWSMGPIFGDAYIGYEFRLQGGSDKQGFPMVQGVMAPSRVALLIKRGAPGFQAFRGSEGERRRKALRGCIVSSDIAVLNVVIVKIGENPIEGVTDCSAPCRLGPKRASNIRKLFCAPKTADVAKLAIRRPVTKAGKKDRFKAARIQRLVTPAIRARRAQKVKKTLAAIRENALERREYLTRVSRSRMVTRQRKNATMHRRKTAQEKIDVPAFKKAGSPKSTKK